MLTSLFVIINNWTCPAVPEIVSEEIGQSVNKMYSIHF